MSVNLECPNCNRVIGFADAEDNYIEKYFYHDGKGNPECPTCKSYIFKKDLFLYFFYRILIISGIIGLIYYILHP
jgi:hypothetical protein